MWGTAVVSTGAQKSQRASWSPGEDQGTLAGLQASLVIPGPTLDPDSPSHPQAPTSPVSNPLTPSHVSGGPLMPAQR